MPVTPKPAEPTTIPPGFSPRAFGKYVLVDKIATGGMAEIFKAKTYSHGGFENLVVIKRILPHVSENADFVEMFVDEAKVSIALKHPNIVRMYDFGKIQGNFYIAMECVDGKDLRHLVRMLGRRREALPVHFAAYIALEVCKGLHYAHTKADPQGRPFGIVHRDISPSNVLLTYEGEVKIADFGIAKAESNATETRAGTLKGKFEYMSPEQAEGRELDHRSDLFSVGILLYEMTTGRRLFKAKSEVATLQKITEGVVPLPTNYNAGIPPALEEICLRALALEPDARYRTAQEMGDALRDHLSPRTAETIAAELRAYVQALFAEEAALERTRLAAADVVALQLKDKLPPGDWDGSVDSTVSEFSASDITAVSDITAEVTATTVRTLVPWIGGIGLAMLLLTGLTLVTVARAVASRPPPPEPAPVVLPVERAAAGIDVLVVPEARILLDGQPQGATSTLDLDGLEPGTYLLRFEADGYVPAEEWVRVESGQRVRIAKQLAVEASAPVPTPSPTALPAAGDLLGTWSGSGGLGPMTLEITSHQGRSVRGTARVRGVTLRVSGSLSADEKRLSLSEAGGPAWLTGVVDGRKIQGTWRRDATGQEYQWLVVR